MGEMIEKSTTSIMTQNTIASEVKE